MTDLQAELQAAAEEMVATPAETGLQVAVHRYGQVIADVTAGVADPRTGAQVTPGTLFYAAPTGKGVTASLTHILAERGDLHYDMRLADVWPEFAARGKEPTTVRHVLLHTATPGSGAVRPRTDLAVRAHHGPFGKDQIMIRTGRGATVRPGRNAAHVSSAVTALRLWVGSAAWRWRGCPRSASPSR